MNPYNGFTPKQRMVALAWLKGQVAMGWRHASPSLCQECGRTDGWLEWHSEDYSAPFGANIGEHGLCYLCHLMLHCRFRSPARWDAYVAMLAAGRRTSTLIRDRGHGWRVLQEFLSGREPETEARSSTSLGPLYGTLTSAAWVHPRAGEVVASPPPAAKAAAVQQPLPRVGRWLPRVVR